MDEYKGISREKNPSWSGWYWLLIYCKNHDPKILENDIVLQDKVKSFYFWKNFKIISLLIGTCLIIAYTVYTLKG